MYILGISSFSHESSCALIKDGVLCSLLEEERFNREKHTWKYPQQAIQKCLDMEGITIHDIDHFTFFWKPVNEIKQNLSHFLSHFPTSINLLRTHSGSEGLTFFQRIWAMQTIGRSIQQQFNLSKPPKIHFVEHHLAHAASAFFVSPYEEAAILTIDGRGESTSTMMAFGKGNVITKLKEIAVPHSLGHLYASITDFLGFKPFFDEWKVMGMSAYGKDTFCKDFEDLVFLFSDGSYQLNLKYFQFHTHGQAQWLSQKFFERFGNARIPKSEYLQKHFDVAFALQKLVEKIGLHLAKHLHAKTQCKTLCLTGGVVLNCLMNKRIIAETPFENFFIQPIANDAGTSYGSALYLYHHELKKPRKYEFDRVYHGPEFSNDEIEVVLRDRNIQFQKSNDIAKDTARHIADGEIVGWFQGRMEAGPRALGNRSITVNPMLNEMKDKLNERVKRREFFRPFAPSVLEERAADFFDMPKNQKSPYMILIGDVKDEIKDKIPAVTHADRTARVHTVNKEINPRYWNLINEFGKITGVPVLINTSFNENEPIVCNPQEAVDCFFRTEFDVLSIGDYLILKKENLKHVKN